MHIDKEFMKSYFKNLMDYQDTLLKERNHKLSDVSDKSGNVSEEHKHNTP